MIYKFEKDKSISQRSKKRAMFLTIVGSVMFELISLFLVFYVGKYFYIFFSFPILFFSFCLTYQKQNDTQSIEIYEDKIVCNNYLSDTKGNFKSYAWYYKDIDRVIFRKRFMFYNSGGIIIVDTKGKPLVINEGYNCYSKIINIVCQKCKEQNKKLEIDSRIQQRYISD